MLNWLVHTSGSTSVDAWSAVGTILLCIISGLMLLVILRFLFSKVFRLMTGYGMRAVRLMIAGGIYVPLFVWWIHHAVTEKADLKQWLLFFFLLLIINYIPVNILSQLIDHMAEKRRDPEYVMQRQRIRHAKRRKRKMKKLMKQAEEIDQMKDKLSTQERLEKKASIYAALAEMETSNNRDEKETVIDRLS